MKYPFLKTRSAQRDVFLVLTRDFPDQGKGLCVFLTAAYGLVNDNSKWKHLSNDLLVNDGFEPLALLPQIFVMCHEFHVVYLTAKSVHEILLCGPNHIVPSVIEKFYARFTLGTIAHGLGIFATAVLTGTTN